MLDRTVHLIFEGWVIDRRKNDRQRYQSLQENIAQYIRLKMLSEQYNKSRAHIYGQTWPTHQILDIEMVRPIHV